MDHLWKKDDPVFIEFIARLKMPSGVQLRTGYWVAAPHGGQLRTGYWVAVPKSQLSIVSSLGQAPFQIRFIAA